MVNFHFCLEGKKGLCFGLHFIIKQCVTFIFYYSLAVINIPDKVLEPLKIEVSLHGSHRARISLLFDLLCPLSPVNKSLFHFHKLFLLSPPKFSVLFDWNM